MHSALACFLHGPCGLSSRWPVASRRESLSLSPSLFCPPGDALAGALKGPCGPGSLTAHGCTGCTCMGSRRDPETSSRWEQASEVAWVTARQPPARLRGLCFGNSGHRLRLGSAEKGDFRKQTPLFSQIPRHLKHLSFFTSKNQSLLCSQVPRERALHRDRPHGGAWGRRGTSGQEAEGGGNCGQEPYCALQVEVSEAGKQH